MNLLALIQRLRTLDLSAQPQLEAKLRWMLLDSWACAVAGSRAAPVAALAAQLSPTPSPGRLWAPGPQTSPQSLALWLAMATCWDEACEGHALAHGRPGVAALAALLPMSRDLSWDEFRRALLVGYEVGARMGALLRIRPGMHVDGNWPALGAAAAAACAMGLDDVQVQTAVQIAACQLPVSLYRPVQTGDTARNTYLGHAAALGQMAALAAASGIGAPADALQAYAQVGLGQSAPDLALPAPEACLLLDAYFKPYAAVRHVHYGAAAAQVLREALQGRAAQRIRLQVYEEATIYCGNRAPKTPLQAQFSLSFGVAAMLCWGRLDPWIYREPQFHDAELRRLEAAVEIEVDVPWTTAHQRGARLHLQLEGGTTLSHEVTAVAGDPAQPMTEAELEHKFLAYCTGEGAEAPARQALAQQWLARVRALTPDAPMSGLGW